MAPAYVEPLSGRLYPLEVPRWRSDDGLPLMITPLPGIGRGDVAAERRDCSRTVPATAAPRSRPTRRPAA
jgi:threonine synthase